MDSQSQSPFQCPICYENFDDDNNLPTCLPCGHSCCLKHCDALQGKCFYKDATFDSKKLKVCISLRDGAIAYKNVCGRLIQEEKMNENLVGKLTKVQIDSKHSATYSQEHVLSLPIGCCEISMKDVITVMNETRCSREEALSALAKIKNPIDAILELRNPQKSVDQKSKVIHQDMSLKAKNEGFEEWFITEMQRNLNKLHSARYPFLQAEAQAKTYKYSSSVQAQYAKYCR